MSSPARRPLPGRPPTPTPSGRVTPAGAPERPARAQRTPRARRAPRERRPRVEHPPPRSRLDPSSWSGAIILMLTLTAVVWVVQVVNEHENYGLNRFGLRPRETAGLWGVLTMPFLHASWDHLLSNTAPLVLIGWVVMIGGLRMWAIVTLTVMLVGGLLTWAVGPGDTVIIGASALVFGWLGYLIARACITRKIRWIVSTALVLIFFGTLLYGLVPVSHAHTSWQAHVCSFIAGAAVGATLHTRGGNRRWRRRAAVS